MRDKKYREEEIWLAGKEAVLIAARSLGFSDSRVRYADNLPGCSIAVLRFGPYQGEVNVRFLFKNDPSRLHPPVEIQVAAFVEKVKGLPYLCQNVEVDNFLFTYQEVQPWLARTMKKAVEKVRVLCTDSNFERLKELHLQRTMR